MIVRRRRKVELQWSPRAAGDARQRDGSIWGISLPPSPACPPLAPDTSPLLSLTCAGLGAAEKDDGVISYVKDNHCLGTAPHAPLLCLIWFHFGSISLCVCVSADNLKDL